MEDKDPVQKMMSKSKMRQESYKDKLNLGEASVDVEVRDVTEEGIDEPSLQEQTARSNLSILSENDEDLILCLWELRKSRKKR